MYRVIRPTAPKSKLANGKTVINLASYNFYNLNANEQIKDKAIQTLRTYGVGPCGPPQFYGTQDVHMKTEADIASYLGTESCIVYAQAFSTISSVIPAFCKRGDIIVADKAVNYAILKGLQISRSNIKWYNHGDMEDLERVMKKVVQEQAKKKLTRRFIVTEGLFETTGDCNNLPKLVELKEKYKFRLVLDETWSFGVLGRTGRGLTEAQNVDSSQVDMIVGSLAGPLCAGGGFCAGPKMVVEHQRINAASYCFSAALPAMMAVTASETLNVLQSNPEILQLCRENIKTMKAQLDPRSDWVTCTSDPANPVMTLVIKPEVINARRLSLDDQERLLQDCVDEVCFPKPTPFSITKALTPQTGPRKRYLDHQAAEPADHGQHRPQGQLVDRSAGSEGLRHLGPVQEGDREGGHVHSALHYQGHDAQDEQQAGRAGCCLKKLVMKPICYLFPFCNGVWERWEVIERID
jgi:serine palmitoyltransferase